MCLYLDSNDSKVHIATHDIFVYKILSYCDYSTIQYFRYKPNTTYFEIEFNYNGKGYINDGFHAYLITDSNVLTKVRENIMFGDKLVQFIIPKGAKYYIGVDDDVVSDTIISGNLEPM